jgi:phenylacetate-coenzyme A ligase PaaK-like adenylate-forming protein
VYNNKPLINTNALLQVNAAGFEDIALQVFRYQHEGNALYRQYCDALHINANNITRLTDIPFLPISFFKTHRIVTEGGFAPGALPMLTFESSGTTGETPSRHYVMDAAIYEKSLLQGFEAFYGAPAGYAILALLPSYLERKNASLVHMAQQNLLKTVDRTR